MSIITLFLAGDVMTGRGIDQILPCPSVPELHEPCVKDARVYVHLAEAANGPVRRGVNPAYIWGDALAELERLAPHARIVNLETSVTRSDEWWRNKGIHYRMDPANVPCLTAAGIDACALANNHALDYGYTGLEETLGALAAAGLKTAGAGRNLTEAQRPAVLDLPAGHRAIVFSFGSETSGVPQAWAATEGRPGLNLLKDLSPTTADEVIERIRRVKRPGDVVIASIHWGDNWGYAVPPSQVNFAHCLIEGGVDIIHGHSSHHPRPIEVYRDKLLLYGCGDFIDDYEGISGYEEFRNDLGLMYFPALESATGRLVRLGMRSMQIRNMTLNRASRADVEWQRDTLSRVSRDFGSQVRLAADGSLVLRACSGRIS